MTAAPRSAGRAIRVALILISLPMLFAAGEAVSFHHHNRNTGSIVSSGETREYVLYVPRTYDAAKPAPLVLSLHGAGMWPVAQMEVSRWNEAAERHGLIVVYPSGSRTVGPRIWRVGGTRLAADVRFISDLIDTLQASYHIDPRRIYANGLSNGGGMSFALSCTLADRIAAVGLVGSAQLIEWSWCPDQRPVPMINFHGTEDRFAQYHGGRSFVAERPFPSIPLWTEVWARRNRCAPEAVDTVLARDVTRRWYRNCANNADVQLYTIIGGGHTWPGGGPMPEWFVGPTSRSVSATEEMWAFFRDHPLPRRVPSDGR
jgi:polyhydroxybutyrate depolymerase